jgi:hypothetical protein
MSNFVGHESCPKCGSRDNLGRYEDGSAWCFGCHFWQPPDSWRFAPAPKKEKEDDVIQLSDDLCFDYPRHVVDWLAKYGITVEESIKHGWKYSPKWDQLTFIFYGNEGEGKQQDVVCTQARNFSPSSKRKYFNQGSAGQSLPIFVSKSGKQSLVVVEDAVSAAKIARQCDSMPCLGSYLPLSKMKALRLLNYATAVFWLDSDKLKESRQMAEQAKWLGFNTKVVYTELDPKEYDDKQIAEFVSI